MSENLTLRIRAENVEWLLHDEISGITRLRGHGTFTEFQGLLDDISWAGETRLMIAGEEVLLAHAHIPSRQPRQVLQALPFAVEEQLACDVEDCHLAIGSRNSDNELAVVVIDRKKFSSVVQQVQDCGLVVTRATVDFLLIPDDAGTNVLVDGERVHIRTEFERGITVELSQLAFSVALLSEDQRENIHIHCHPDALDGIQLAIAEIEADERSTVVIHELASLPFEYLCQNFDRGTIDLLQAEFKVEKKRKVNKGWRAVAVLAACAIAGHLLIMLGKGIFLHQQADDYAGQAKALYKEVFPKDRNVRDIRRRWSSHLNGGKSNSDSFLRLFGEVAVNLPGSNIELQNVNFNESRGDLILQLLASRSEQLVLFSETLSKQGLSAEIGTISQDEDSVRGSIKIKSFVGRRK